MPFKSEAQRKAIYAAAEGKSTEGISKEVAKKFIEDSKKKKSKSSRLYKEQDGK
jgi:hypothetical protein